MASKSSKRYTRYSMKILVIGDSCVDNFVYCDISRLCPEAPVPVLQPINTVTNAGVAGNVVRNLIALGAEVELITNEINIRKTRYVDIIVTDGKNGATYKNKNYPVEAEVKVSNVSGAGDTFLAGLVYAYVKSDNITEAISFANQCASKVVQERGVTVI